MARLTEQTARMHASRTNALAHAGRVSAKAKVTQTGRHIVEITVDGQSSWDAFNTQEAELAAFIIINLLANQPAPGLPENDASKAALELLQRDDVVEVETNPVGAGRRTITVHHTDGSLTYLRTEAEIESAPQITALAGKSQTELQHASVLRSWRRLSARPSSTGRVKYVEDDPLLGAGHA